ncbi:MAG: ribosome-recycling factor [Patescibacteria group bacterium]
MAIYQDIIDRIKPECDKTVSFFNREMEKIRTGRATPALVEDVVVDCFNQKLPLKQLGAISIPEARQILIQPWDASYIPGIVAALERTGVGANPIVDKNSIRISLPLITADYRKDLMRLISEKQEEARKTIRKWREEAWNEIQVGFRESTVREDDKFRAKDDLQKLVDEYSKKIEEIGERKKKETEL